MLNSDAAIAPATSVRLERRPRFFLGMSVAVAATVFCGFAPSFYLRRVFALPLPPMRPVVQVHGVVFTVWFLLLVVQASLIASRRVATHRALGIGGVLLAATMVVIASIADITTPNGPWARWFAVQPSAFATVLAFFSGNTGPLASFALLFGAAVYLRHRPEAHRRLVLLASVALLPAAITRVFASIAIMIMGQQLPPPWLGWVFANGLAIFMSLPFFVALVVYDLIWLQRIHPATAWGGAVAYLPPWIAFLLVQRTAAFAAVTA